LTLVFPWFKFDRTFCCFVSMSTKENQEYASGIFIGQGEDETPKSSDFTIKKKIYLSQSNMCI
jgi:hypothetical protein